MKLLGILISFALVGHVLGTELDKYIEEVILTNQDIRQAKDIMPEIIKRIVLNSDEYWMQTMALMLSVPEVLDVKLKRPESDSDTEENIVGTLEGPGPSQNQIPDLNIDPSTVPQEDVNTPNFVGKTIIQLEEKLKYQKMMRLAILAVTDRVKYEKMKQTARPDTTPIHSLDLNRPPDSEKRRIESPTTKLENLVSVLEERRMHSTVVSRKRIIRAFSLNSLGRERRKMTLEAITLLIHQDDVVFQDLYKMCRLVGLFRSIKYPHSYIAVTQVDEEYCYLMDALEVEGFIYTFINDEFWEVEVSSRRPIKRFLSELQ